MISSNKGEVSIEGTPADIMSETVQIVADVVDAMVKNMSTPITREKVLEDINEGVRFTFLIKSGMTPEEAMDVIFPNKEVS